MVLLKKRPHLVLKITLRVMRGLLLDIRNEGADICGTNREQTIPTLPRETRNTLALHPSRRARLNLRHDLCRRACRRQSQRKMNVIGDTTNAKAFATKRACCTREIGVKLVHQLGPDQRQTPLRAEHHMHQVKAQCLRHGTNYMSGLQPSHSPTHADLGLRPRLVCRRAFGPQTFRRTPLYPQPTSLHMPLHRGHYANE
jgi:hypothetical protein